MIRAGLALVLALGVLASSVGIVTARQDSRRLFVALQALHQERDAMNTRWGQLQLELAAWSASNRIEDIARGRLDMVMAPIGAIVVVEP